MSTTDDPMPDLIRGLRNPLPDMRLRSARSLGRLGWLARDAMPLLVEALDDPNPGVREAAAQAIGQMGPEALPHLAQMISHEDKYVRRNAVWALGKLGPLAKTAIPDLCLALRDQDPRTASGAAQALGNMGPDSSDAVAALTEAMRGTNVVLCRLASKALSRIGNVALGALITHLRHRDPFVRGEAALALGWMGASAASSVPALVEALRVSHIQVPRMETVPIGGDTPPIPQPGGNVSVEDTSRAFAAQALGRIGPAAESALPSLMKATYDPCDQVRQSALQAIKQIQQR